MGDGRQLRAASEPDIDVVLRNGGELALPTDDEPVPALGDELLAVAAATAAAAAAAAIPATLFAAPFIFPIATTGTTAAAAAITTAAATTIAGVALDVGLVYGDSVASSRATLLSPSTRRSQSYRQQRL